MLNLKSRLKIEIHNLLKDRYPLELEKIELGYTPDIRMGDLALSFPFQLAKELKRAPRDIAREIAPLLTGLAGVERCEVAGAGYLNLYLDRSRFFSQKLKTRAESTLVPEEMKVIVEHTSINPNKAAHIGHLRNSTLGDTLVRALQYKGEHLEIQNYIDDTGVQVADVVFGFMELENKSLEQIQAIPGKFDFYCWDLYTRVAPYIENHPEAKKRKDEILKHIEEGTDPEAEIGFHVSRRILKAHLQTMRRLGITYDLQACESSIIGLKFWEKAFNLLKERGAIYFVEDGANRGCWVMRLEDGQEQEKILVRSNGTVTYTGKDIAYQLWKFGLLDGDFYYEPFVQQGERTIWITTSQPPAPGHSEPPSPPAAPSSSPQTSEKEFPFDLQVPEFGHGSVVYNVIDVRQSYPQKIVAQGLKSLKYERQFERSIHFSYEMVALSPESLKDLGLTVAAEDRERDFLEMSGRKGLGIKADDLLDRMEEKALVEVEKRNPEFSREIKREIARGITTGALRYFMLKYARNSVIVFDFEDVLSFEGETGPYLQYSLVRINSIFRKLEDVDGFTQESLVKLIDDTAFSLNLLADEEAADFWELVSYAAQLDEEVVHSLRSLEFMHLAKYTFNLCQKFNGYYHKYPVVKAKDPDLKSLRIATISFVRETLKTALDLMGIPQPERM